MRSVKSAETTKTTREDNKGKVGIQYLELQPAINNKYDLAAEGWTSSVDETMEKPSLWSILMQVLNCFSDTFYISLVNALDDQRVSRVSHVVSK